MEIKNSFPTIFQIELKVIKNNFINFISILLFRLNAKTTFTSNIKRLNQINNHKIKY